MWKVWLTDKRIWHERVEVHGLTNFERHYILISLHHDSMRALHETAMHELVHAGCGDGMREEHERVAEESTARRCEAGLTRILLGMGFEFPPLPDGMRLITS